MLLLGWVLTAARRLSGGREWALCSRRQSAGSVCGPGICLGRVRSSWTRDRARGLLRWQVGSSLPVEPPVKLLEEDLCSPPALTKAPSSVGTGTLLLRAGAPEVWAVSLSLLGAGGRGAGHVLKELTALQEPGDPTLPSRS